LPKVQVPIIGKSDYGQAAVGNLHGPTAISELNGDGRERLQEGFGPGNFNETKLERKLEWMRP
jgi:hypothetical protein